MTVGRAKIRWKDQVREDTQKRVVKSGPRFKRSAHGRIKVVEDDFVVRHITSVESLVGGDELPIV
jgi:hypothetical protein